MSSPVFAAAHAATMEEVLDEFGPLVQAMVVGFMATVARPGDLDELESDFRLAEAATIEAIRDDLEWAWFALSFATEHPDLDDDGNLTGARRLAHHLLTLLLR